MYWCQKSEEEKTGIPLQNPLLLSLKWDLMGHLSHGHVFLMKVTRTFPNVQYHSVIMETSGKCNCVLPVVEDFKLLLPG